MGAPDPRISVQKDVQTAITAQDIEKAKAEFWAYQQPQKTVAPAVKNDPWCQNEIDYYVLLGLETAEITPAEDAEPRAIVRREVRRLQYVILLMIFWRGRSLGNGGVATGLMLYGMQNPQAEL